MANTFSFKEVITKTMKISGVLDSCAMTVDVEGEEKSLFTLLSAFNGAAIDLMVKVKSEEELEEPTSEEDE